jgi:hypothetical protein
MSRYKYILLIIGILGISVLLCAVLYIAAGYYFYSQGSKQIEIEAEQMWVRDQVAHLNKLYSILTNENLDDLATVIQGRINEITSSSRYAGGIGPDVDLFRDELNFMYSKLSQLKQHGSEESLQLVNDRCVVLRIRLLQQLPLRIHKVELGKDQIPSQFYYNPNISAFDPTLVGKATDGDFPPDNDKDYMLHLAEKIPPRTFSGKDWVAVTYYIDFNSVSEDEFINGMQQFYSEKTWSQIDYDLYFPQMSEFMSNQWYKTSNAQKLWSSYWAKDELGVINANLFYLSENVGNCVIWHSTNPGLQDLPIKYDDWIRSMSDKDDIILLFD